MVHYSLLLTYKTSKNLKIKVQYYYDTIVSLIGDNDESCALWVLIFKYIEESIGISSLSLINKPLLLRPVLINNINFADSV